MKHKNNLSNSYIKDVARLIAVEWGVEFKEVKGNLALASWFDIDPSSPLAAHLKGFAVHIHYSAIESIQDIQKAWYKVLRLSEKESKRPVLIWRTEYYPWQVATLGRLSSLKGEIPLSWAYTVRRDLSLWCAEVQDDTLKSLKG